MYKRFSSAIAAIGLALSLSAPALADRISVDEIPLSALHVQSADAAHFTLTESKSWNDSLGGHIFVHTTIVVHGGAKDGQIDPARLVLALKMRDGSTKYFGAMTTAAPQRVKVGFADAYAVPQVDPDTDLGAQGPLGIPAHGSMTVTVTFYVGLNPAADFTGTPGVLVVR